MSAKDNTEKVLRDIHVLFSKAEPVEGSAMNVIINKNDAMELLKELNDCMYEMMDEYELTRQSRAKAERATRREGDDIIFESTRKAEDIYAASVMYTDNALNEIQEIIQSAIDRFDEIYDETKKHAEQEIKNVKKNQSDLKADLADLIDTQKYLHLIEDENRRLKKEKEGRRKDSSAYDSLEDKIYANVQPEIVVNEEYFRQQGLNPDGTPLEENLTEEAINDMSDDLDAEYFGWKEGDDTGETYADVEGASQSDNTDKKNGVFGALFGKK